MRKNYGYKICYRHKGKDKLKVFIVTNNYDYALWRVRWLEGNADKQLEDITWLVLPITSFLEYKWLWRGCPF